MLFNVVESCVEDEDEAGEEEVVGNDAYDAWCHRRDLVYAQLHRFDSV